MRYLLVASPAAGNTDGSSLDDAVGVLREGGEVEVAESGSDDELDAVLDRTDGRTIVVAGGDGSLHAVMAALHRRRQLADQPLGLVPLGTGNDFARSLELPLEPVAAAQRILDGAPRPIDLLLGADGGVVVNSVHAGAGVAAARAGASWKERIGRAGYVVGAVVTAVRPPNVRVKVTVDGEVVHDGSVLQVAVGNGPYVGGGTALVPEARPDDGVADVLLAKPATGRARLTYAVRMLAGRHHLHADVRTFRGRDVEVTGSGFWCSADGEITGPYDSRRWRVEPAAYRLLH